MKFKLKSVWVVGALVGLLVVGGCSSPKTPPQRPVVALPVPAALPEPAALEVFTVRLKEVTRQSFAGIFQDEEPKLLWTLAHYSPLGHPAVSPDGRWLVLTRGDVRENLVLVLVDLTNRTAREHKVAAPGIVNHAVFSRDSSELLAVVNTPGGYAFARWSLPAMTLVMKPLAAGNAMAAAFTNAQDQAVVMRADGVIGVFDLATAAKRFEVNFQQGAADIYSVSLAVSPDDKFVSSGVIHPGNEYVRWSLADGSRVDTPPLKEHLSWGRPAAATRDGKTIFVAAHHDLFAVNAATGERSATYPGNGLNTLHYQPTVDMVAAPVGNSQTFAVIEGATGQQRFWVKHEVTPPAQYPYVGWAAVAPDGKTAYSANYTSIKAWDLAAATARGPDWLTIGTKPLKLFPSASGDSLMAVGETIDTWDLRTRRLTSTQPATLLRGDRAGDRDEWRTGRGTLGLWRSGDALHALRLDDDGAQVYDVGANKPVLRLGISRSAFGLLSKEVATPELAIWHGASSRASARLATFPYSDGYLQVTASPDARLLLVTNSDGSAVLWSLETGRRLTELADSSIGVQKARFSPDGKRVLMASRTGELAIFYLHENAAPTLEVISMPTARDRIISSASDIVMPTADRIYIGTTGGYLQSWQRGTTGWSQRFEHLVIDANTSSEFPGPIGRIAVSPSGRTVAVAISNYAERGSILIIDTQTGKVRNHLEDAATDLYFRDETTLVTTGIRLWKIGKSGE